MKMKMNAGYGGEYNPYCYFHPTEIVVGICALCLRERLQELALKQGHHPIPVDSGRRASKRKHSFTLPNIFALGSFLRVDTRQQRPEENFSDHGSITSLEDSFISIKFEDNGEASWESKKKKQAEEEFLAQHSEKETRELGLAEKSLVEHVTPRGSTLRWRKRIGQLLQLSRWKKSSKTGGASHVGLVGKVEGRRGWMRSLTARRRTTE